MTYALAKSLSWIIQTMFLDGDDGSSRIINPTAPNAQLRLQKVVHVFIINGHYSYESIVELCNDNWTMFDRSRIPLPCIHENSLRRSRIV